MRDQGFQLQARRIPGGVSLDMVGPLGQEGGDAIRQAVTESEPPGRLVLNFTRTFPLSTAGLAGVLFTVRHVTRAGGRVSAYGLSDHYRKVFHVMGLTHYVRVCLDEASALE